MIILQQEKLLLNEDDIKVALIEKYGPKVVSVNIYHGNNKYSAVVVRDKES